MPKFETDRIVGHSAEAMFDLVADVDSYPEFVPFCESIVVRARQSEDASGQAGRDAINEPATPMSTNKVMIVDMTVGYKLIHETFTSRVRLDRTALTIKADYLDGPFRSMENLWTFAAIDQKSCRVTFKIDYEFRSRALSLVMGSLFDKAFRRFSYAFEDRAGEIYGKPVGAVSAR